MKQRLQPYRVSLAGTLLAAREAVMGPIRQCLRDAGMTEQQWRVLRVLADEGPQEPSRLAVAALLHAPSVTRILRELVARDLIERAIDPIDGRRSIVSLSPQGEALIDRLSPRIATVLDRYGDQFGAARLSALLGELRAFASAINSGADAANAG